MRPSPIAYSAYASLGATVLAISVDSPYATARFADTISYSWVGEHPAVFPPLEQIKRAVATACENGASR